MGGHTLIGGLISDVLNLLGLGGHNETFSDISISNLLTKGIASDMHRRAALAISEGDMDVYNKTLFNNKRQYRRKYSESTIRKYGYEPSISARQLVLDENEVIEYIRNNVDSRITEVILLTEGAADIGTAVYYELQKTYGTQWSNYNYTLSVGDSNYRYSSAVKVSSSSIEVVLRRLYAESIYANLISNYNYNEVDNTVAIASGSDTYVLAGTSQVDSVSVRINIVGEYDTTINVVGGEDWELTTTSLLDGTYNIEIYESNGVDDEVLVDSYSITIDSTKLYYVGDINGNIYDGQYRTSVTLVSDDNVVEYIYTDLEDMVIDVSSTLYDTETMQVHYKINTSDEYYIYLEDLDTVPSTVRTESVLALTPIITVKAENQIVDKEDRNLQLMLKNVGVDAESIFPSLDQEDLNSAYLIYGIPFDTTDTSCYKAMFEMFNLNLTNQGNIVIKISNLNMTYSYGYRRAERVGNIGKVGTVTKTDGSYTTSSTDSNGDTTITSHQTWTLRKQVTTEEYIEIVVTDLMLSYYISGEYNTCNMSSGGDEARLLIPLEVLHKLKMKDYYNVYEESLALLAYAEKTMYIEWYETEFFQFVMQIAGVVIMIVGLATGNYAMVYWGLGIMAANYAIDWAVDNGYLSPEQGAVLKVIVAIVAYIYSPASATDNLMYQNIGLGFNVMGIFTTMKGQQLGAEQEAFDDLSQAANDQLEDIKAQYGYDNLAQMQADAAIHEAVFQHKMVQAEQRRIASGKAMSFAEMNAYSATIDAVAGPLKSHATPDKDSGKKPPKMQLGKLYG